MEPRTSRRPDIRVLLLADDTSLAPRIEATLVEQGFALTTSAARGSALADLNLAGFEAVVIHVAALPDNGAELCREVRQVTTLPVLVVSPEATEEERIAGLAAGADHYLSAPVSLPEVVARVCAAIRRARGEAGPVLRNIVIDDLTLEPTALRVMRDGKSLGLTSYEFALLYALACRAGKVVSRDELLTASGGDTGQVESRSIDVHLSRIRGKVGDDARNPTLIKTVRGAGYMLALSRGP